MTRTWPGEVRGEEREIEGGEDKEEVEEVGRRLSGDVARKGFGLRSAAVGGKLFIMLVVVEKVGCCRSKGREQ